jgi:hypothetical protein
MGMAEEDFERAFGFRHGQVSHLLIFKIIQLKTSKRTWNENPKRFSLANV